VWCIGARRYAVDAGHCLVLNHGARYSLVFETAEPVETFCPFFAAGFVEDALSSVLSSEEALLDDPRETAGRLVVAPHVRPLQSDLAAPLAALRRLARTRDSADLDWDDAFCDLARALACATAGWRTEHGGRSRRASTRSEITRRLNRARDFIHAEAHRRLVLADIADVACLSAHHFHRLFATAFHASPGAYVTALRLNRAARRLAATDTSITEICLSTGFESLGSFSTRFRRSFGVPPGAWRRIARSEKPAIAPRM
jgi:AraC-like DNA-binding protein